MSKYVVISNHPPESCPSANKALRAKAANLEKELGALFQQHSITPQVISHLDPGHKILMVLDAPNSEAIRDVIYASGLSQWNDFEFYMASSIPEVLGWTEKLQPLW